MNSPDREAFPDMMFSNVAISSEDMEFEDFAPHDPIPSRLSGKPGLLAGLQHVDEAYAGVDEGDPMHTQTLRPTELAPAMAKDHNMMGLTPQAVLKKELLDVEGPAPGQPLPDDPTQEAMFPPKRSDQLGTINLAPPPQPPPPQQQQLQPQPQPQLQQPPQQRQRVLQQQQQRQQQQQQQQQQQPGHVPQMLPIPSAWHFHEATSQGGLPSMKSQHVTPGRMPTPSTAPREMHPLQFKPAAGANPTPGAGEAMPPRSFTASPPSVPYGQHQCQPQSHPHQHTAHAQHHPHHPQSHHPAPPHQQHHLRAGGAPPPPTFGFGRDPPSAAPLHGGAAAVTNSGVPLAHPSTPAMAGVTGSTSGAPPGVPSLASFEPGSGGQAPPWGVASSHFWRMINQTQPSTGLGKQLLGHPNPPVHRNLGDNDDSSVRNISDRRRQDRNNREQKRSKRISDQIKELKILLEQSGVSVQKGNKSAILTSAADFIMQLQRQNETLASQPLRGGRRGGGDGGDGGGGSGGGEVSGGGGEISEIGSGGGGGGGGGGDKIGSGDEGGEMHTDGNPPDMVGSAPMRNPAAVAVDAAAGANEEGHNIAIDYQRVFYEQSIPMAITAVDGRFIDCNWRFEQESGYTKHALLKMTFFSLARMETTDSSNIFQSVAEMLNTTSEGRKHCVFKATLNTTSDAPRFIKLSTVHDCAAPNEVKYFTCAVLFTAKSP